MRRSGVHVFGEPLGRQLASDAAGLRLPVHRRSGGRELKAHPDVVQKAGHLGRAPSAGSGPRDQVLELRERPEVSVRTEAPALSLGGLGQAEACGDEMLRPLFVGVHDDAIGGADRRDILSRAA